VVAGVLGCSGVPGGCFCAPLPQEVGEHLRRAGVWAGFGIGERFDREDFRARVAERASVREQQAAYITRAVTEVVSDSTQGGLMGKVADSLPSDVRDLVTAGSSGKATGSGGK
jgi:uncharacterized protein (DUF2267 family)